MGLDSKGFIMGENVKQVTKISYRNSILNKLKENKIWKNTLKQLSLNTNDIKRTYFYTSKLNLVTIPILKGTVESVLNIYIYEDNFLITKISTIKQESGNSLYKVSTVNNELYYQFELDNNRRIGRWKFDKEIPFNETFQYLSNNRSVPSGRVGDAPCASQPFYECMNCFIVKTCGSDWVCVAACGYFLYQCIAGAAAACIIL